MENSKELSSQRIEIADGFSVEFLDAILKLEKECLPKEWQYDDAEEYYEKILKDKSNINIFLKNGGELVGYVLARLHNNELQELVSYDPKLRKRNGFYIETIQILPGLQGMGGARRLLLAVCEEGRKRDITKFSIHARTVNGFSEKFKKIFKDDITLVRQIKSWEPAGGEPYEYIECDINNFKQ